ncbi:MAG TPA: DUF6624 domain-containing protein [Trebonia sp.]|jgi:hypothetical protein|nr:DUF6624 domain-containing protein [Trebonia sp.]
MSGLDEALRAELLRRMDKDQVARKALDLEAASEADEENLPWLKGVLAAHGWPGKSLVGEDGARAAWLLAQHADRDTAFQRQCLDLMTVAVEAGEARVHLLAYLTDRVLLHEGQPQVYGTQVTRQDGQVVPRDVTDPDRLDERRAAVGLPSFAEYTRAFEEPSDSRPRLRCPGCGGLAAFDEPEAGQPVDVTCPDCGRKTTIRLNR